MNNAIVSSPRAAQLISLQVFSDISNTTLWQACHGAADTVASKSSEIATGVSSFVELDDLRSSLAADKSSIQLVLIPVELFDDSAVAPKTVAEIAATLRVVSQAMELHIIAVGEGATQADTLVAAMQAGANDCFFMVNSETLLAEKLIKTFQAVVTSYRAALEHTAMQESHQHILHEQQMAKQVFDKVAHEMVELPNVRHWLSPLALFNGDVLLSTPTPSGGLLLLMGDFTGHGLGAALGAIPLSSTFYGMAGKGFALRDVVSEVNRKLYETLPTGVFCCATVVQLDFSTGELEVWNAGLPDALVLRKREQELEVIASSSLALGILSPQAFTFESTRMQLDEGDALYLLTDGLSETQNAEGTQYGESRLRDTLFSTLKDRESRGFDAVKSDVLEFIDTTDRADDISLVEISIVSDEAFSSYFKQKDSLEFDHPVSWSLNMEFRPETLKYQDPVPLILRNLIEEPSLRRFSGRLFTIVSELFNNALDHGLLQLDSTLKHGQSGFVQYYEERASRLAELESGFVRCGLDYRANKDGGELIVEVVDSGEGFDYDEVNEAAKNSPELHGRGLSLVASVTKELVYSENGNRVRAVFSWA